MLICTYRAVFGQSQGHTSCFILLAESNFVMAILFASSVTILSTSTAYTFSFIFSSHLTFLTFTRKHDVVRDFETYECLTDAFEVHSVYSCLDSTTSTSSSPSA